MLMTTAEVKTILGITDTTYDTQIAAFIPYVARDIVSYLGHAFQDGWIYRESLSNFEFVQGDSDTADYITDGESEFVEKGFASGMDIAVEGGFSNVGIYTLDTVAAGQLTLDGYGDIVNQEQNSGDDVHFIGGIRISRIKWPPEIKLPAAKMIWHLIKNAKTDDVQSESLDDYSVTYAGSNAYPLRIVRMLDKFKRLYY